MAGRDLRGRSVPRVICAPANVPARSARASYTIKKPQTRVREPTLIALKSGLIAPIRALNALKCGLIALISGRTVPINGLVALPRALATPKRRLAALISEPNALAKECSG